MAGLGQALGYQDPTGRIFDVSSGYSPSLALFPFRKVAFSGDLGERTNPVSGGALLRRDDIPL